LFFCFILIGI